MKSLTRRFSAPSTLLGIALGGGAMTAAVVRLTGGTPEIVGSCQADLAIDLLSGAPELAGQEIRTRLAEAGIREKRCVVCIPLKWALAMQTDLPDLPEADLASFVRLQAEKSLPFSPEDLILADSRYQCAGAKRGATVAAFPVNRLAALEAVMRAAGLRPVSITFGVSALVDPAATPNSIALLVTGKSVELEIRAGSGAAALRTLEEAVSAESEDLPIDAETIARQLRITLGNLPPSFRGSASAIRLYGPAPLCRALAGELDELARPLGLSAVVAQPGETGVATAAAAQSQDFPWVAALAAARRLGARAPEFEFLPKRPTRWERAMGLVRGRGAMRAAAIAACFVGLVVLAFLIQYVRMARIEGQWRAVEADAQNVEAIQKKLHDYRGWFDNGAPSLEILKRLVSAFPEDGAVWATTVSVKNQSEVTCVANARSDRDWQAVASKLSATKGIKNLDISTNGGGKAAQGAGNVLQLTIKYTDTIGEGNAN